MMVLLDDFLDDLLDDLFDHIFYENVLPKDRTQNEICIEVANQLENFD